MAVDHMVASTARQRLHELTLHTQHGNPISREQTHLLALKRKTATFMGFQHCWRINLRQENVRLPVADSTRVSDMRFTETSR
jgi:hypothetical protein